MSKQFNKAEKSARRKKYIKRKKISTKAKSKDKAPQAAPATAWFQRSVALRPPYQVAFFHALKHKTEILQLG